MSTLSVPLPPNLDEFVRNQVKNGLAPNKAEVVRKALKLLREEEAINEVLRAEKEPLLRGDLRKLAKKLK
jgi:putative addiction module CopG family antidote